MDKGEQLDEKVDVDDAEVALIIRVFTNGVIGASIG
jgi:hypothetical protein